MKTTIIWKDVAIANPKKYKWVLVSTPHCTYKFCTAKWMGHQWIDSDGCVIENVKYWAEVETPNQ